MNAVIYARYSSDNQREESIEGQIREATEYAVKNGFTVVDAYVDRAFSAKTDNRPDFQRMISDSSKQLFDIVIVWKLDRFARDRYDSAHYKRILKKNNVRVVSAKENISEGPDGILLESILEGYAEYYSADLSEKIIRGMTENALKCKYNGGGMPLGYKTDEDNHFIIDPLTAPVVQEIFIRYADGESMGGIIESLSERGLKTATGVIFNRSSLHSLLKNRKYIGEYSYRDLVIPDGVPAIISEEIFNRVQEKMEKNKRAPAANKAEEPFLLTTKIFCGKCGASMIGESGTSGTGKTYHYYKCYHAKRGKTCNKKSVNKNWVEFFVVQKTISEVLVDNVIDAIADSVVAYQNCENATLPLLQMKLSEVEKGIQNILNAIQQGIITPSTKQRLVELESTKSELELSITKEQLIKPQLSKDKIVAWISRFKYGNIEDLAYRQRIIDIFVNSVYVYDDYIELNFNYSDGTQIISFDEINSSDFGHRAPPKNSLKLLF